MAYQSGQADRTEQFRIPGRESRPPFPQPLTSFVGRTQELAAIGQLLQDRRLLTLTGTGGVGKSRLAVEIARETAARGVLAVRFVEFADVLDPSLIPQTVATALGVRELPGQALLDTLAEALRFQPTLLVLDNCEHLAEACGQFVLHVLGWCPELTILATSRAALGIAGEQTWLVDPLSCPEAGDWATTPDRVLSSEAGQLFVQRRRLVVPTLEMTPAEAAPIATICRRLDGLPLALELAAARSAVLSTYQIVERLDNQLGLLSGGGLTALLRHRTVRSMLDWSYDLLNDVERAVFRRASVFVGSWDIEAMEAVCSGGDVAPADMLDLLHGLVNQSLVVVERGTIERRYRLLETVRVYARQKLMEAGEEPSTCQRHSAWYLDLVKPAGHIPWDTRPEDWFTRLETDLTNLRAALDWCLAHEPTDAGGEIMKHLAQYWQIRGHYAEGRRYFDQILRRPDLSSGIRTQILGLAASLTQVHGDQPAAFLLAEEGRLLSQHEGDEIGEAICNLTLAMIASDRGEHDSAISLATQSVHFWRKDGLLQIEAIALGTLARTLSEAGLHDQAITVCEQRRQLARRLGNVRLEALSLMRIGVVQLRCGEHLRAEASLAEALPLFHLVSDHINTVAALEYLGHTAALAQDYRCALQLFGAADQFRERLHSSSTAGAQEDCDRIRSLAAQHVDAETCSALLLEGRTLTIEAILQLVREHAERQTRASVPKQQRGGILTLREREVAALVARGYTNRQIADVLIISDRTAETHTRNIREKLEFTSRAQIASWATANGLTYDA